jgi:hypothetical protein
MFHISISLHAFRIKQVARMARVGSVMRF